MRISDWSSDVCSSDLYGHRMTPSRVPAPDAGLNSTGPHSVGSRWAAYGRQCRAHAARTSTPTPRRCAMKRLIVILAAAGFASVAGAQQPTEVEQGLELDAAAVAVGTEASAAPVSDRHRLRYTGSPLTATETATARRPGNAHPKSLVTAKSAPVR